MQTHFALKKINLIFICQIKLYNKTKKLFRYIFKEIKLFKKNKKYS